MKPFKFKQFTVHQDKAAMKVGTDAVLLGAWCSLENDPNTILDVGSGTGVIGLMLAQRSDAMTIDAVEIDESTYEQSVENFEQSPWADRLFCYNSSFQNFADELSNDNENYDLIISNPPFYKNGYKSDNELRNKARHTNALSFTQLLNGVSKILSDNGVFSVIIPYIYVKEFEELAKKEDLFLNRACEVKGNSDSQIIRSILEFSYVEKTLKKEILIIEKKRHEYTEDYRNLTKDFYLKM